MLTIDVTNVSILAFARRVSRSKKRQPRIDRMPEQRKQVIWPMISHGTLGASALDQRQFLLLGG
jgi:hypothetical protein